MPQRCWTAPKRARAALSVSIVMKFDFSEIQSHPTVETSDSSPKAPHSVRPAITLAPVMCRGFLCGCLEDRDASGQDGGTKNEETPAETDLRGFNNRWFTLRGSTQVTDRQFSVRTPLR